MAPRVSRNLTDGDMANLIDRSDPVILELGSYDGHDGKRFLDLFLDCRLWAWEADPRNIGLCRRTLADTRASVLGQAIHHYDGVCPWYGSSGTPPDSYSGPPLPKANDWDQSSSIHAPTGHLDFSPWVTFPESRRSTVPCMRLDTWLESVEAFGDILVDFIWADLQGAEGDMVLGGVRTLSRTRYLYTESYATPMYDTQLTTAELSAVMRVLDFELVAHYPSENVLFRNKRF